MSSAPDFDPLSPAMLEDPYPVYADLQEKHPVFWHEKVGAWVVTRYDDCREILMNSELFVRDPRRVSEVSAESGESIQGVDVKAQSELRRLVTGSIHAQDLEEIGRRVRASIDRIFEGVLARPSFDWMFEVSARLSGAITADFLGVTEPDPQVFKTIVEGMARKFDADLSEPDPEAEQRVREAFGGLIDGWLSSPETHGTMLTLKNRAAEMGVPVGVIKNLIGLLFIGSFGTIFASSGSLAHLFIQRPDVFEQLRDPALLGTGIEEFLRFDGPTQATSRMAKQETKVSGVTIKQGDPVFVVLAAANRDPRQFPRPHELVLDRAPNRHLGFGWGPHSCLGSLFGQLALRELTCAVHDAPGPLRLAGTPFRLPTTTVRSFASLPVSFQPES
ncbi:cytochrome P450 [Microtetraspora malaysiensis]|uniref:cytochrome P450 n=1 Tax=Microtetraspora malaysiensis TaxID=161358 RepID=UPI003D91809F